MRRIAYIGFFFSVTIGMFSCTQSAPQEQDPELRRENEKRLGEYGDVDAESVSQNPVPSELTDVEKLQLLQDFQSEKRKFDFYASFTEPFWTFYFFGNQVMFVSMDSEVPQIVPLEYPFSEKSEQQNLKFKLNDQLMELEVIKQEGSDGMSEMRYPYTVKLEMIEGGGSTFYPKE